MPARCVREVQTTFQPGRSATRERNPEISSPTSPAHPVRKGRVRDRALSESCDRETPELATSLRTGAPTGVRTRRAHRWTYRSLRPFQTVQRCASSNRAPGHIDTAPYSAKMEWGRVLGFHPQSSGGVPSQALLLTVGAVLRRADKHFDEIVVQSVVELALEAPFELRVVEIAGVQVEIVGVDRDVFVFECNDDFDAVAFGTRRKV